MGKLDLFATRCILTLCIFVGKSIGEEINSKLALALMESAGDDCAVLVGVELSDEMAARFVARDLNLRAVDVSIKDSRIEWQERDCITITTAESLGSLPSDLAEAPSRTVAIVQTGDSPKKSLESVYLRPDSSFVTVDNASLAVKELYQIRKGSPVVSLPCGTLGVAEDVQEIKECMSLPSGRGDGFRRDFFGASVTAVFDVWPPFCSVVRDGDGLEQPRGIFPEIFETVAAALNFTVKYVPNPWPGVWGILNGTSLSGMLGGVTRGESDTSVAGVAVTDERARGGADFSVSVVSSQCTAFVRRPSASVALDDAYTSEFEDRVWLSILLTLLASFAWLSVLGLLLSRAPAVSSLSEAAQIVLRSAIAKPTVLAHSPDQRVSFRVAFIAILVGNLVVFVAFRGAMSAFLAVSLFKLPVRGFQDLTRLEYDLVLWKNDVNEEYLRYIGSLPSSGGFGVYESAWSGGRLRYMGSTAAGVEALLSRPGGVILFEWVESVSAVLEDTGGDPCHVAVVKDISRVMPSTKIAFPLKSGSPFANLFNRELTRMAEAGAVERIKQKYISIKDPLTCEEADKLMQKPLGLDNTALPFLIVAGATVICLAVVIIEKLCFQRGLNTKLPPKEVFMLRKSKVESLDKLWAESKMLIQKRDFKAARKKLEQGQLIITDLSNE